MDGDEDTYSQAKDFGFKLAMEVRQLRKTNEENKIHISDLTETKDTMIRKYELLFAKHRALQRDKEDLENKCITLEDLIFKLEMHGKETAAKLNAEGKANLAKINNLNEINQNLQHQLNSSTETAANQYSELTSLRNQLSATYNDNVLHLQKVDNLSAQLTKIQGFYDAETLSARDKDMEIVRLKNLVHESQLQLTELEGTVKAYKERHTEDGREKEVLQQTVESLELVQQKSTAELKDLRYKVALSESNAEGCCEMEKNEYRLKIQQLRQEGDRLKLNVSDLEAEMQNFKVAVETQNIMWHQQKQMLMLSHHGLRHGTGTRRPASVSDSVMDSSDLDSTSSSSVPDMFATPRSCRMDFTPSTIGTGSSLPFTAAEKSRMSLGAGFGASSTVIGDPTAFYQNAYVLIEKLKRRLHKYYQLAHQYHRDGKEIRAKYLSEKVKTKKLLQAIKIYEEMCE